MQEYHHDDMMDIGWNLLYSIQEIIVYKRQFEILNLKNIFVDGQD